MRAREFDDVIESFPDDVQRLLGFISDIGEAALDNDTVKEVSTNDWFILSDSIQSSSLS